MSNARLHKLILGLNKGEKRYFKLFMKRYSHNNDLSINGRLFDFLVKSKSYNKDILLKKNNYINPKQLNNIQKRLYDYILLSLRTYSSSSTKNEKIYLHQIMINFEILMSKGLYLEALKMLEKAEIIAEENEFHNSLKEILDQKKDLLTTRVKIAGIKSRIIVVREKQEKISRILFYTEKFKEIFNDLYDIFKSEGRVVRDIKLVYDIEKELQKYDDAIVQFQNSYSTSYIYYNSWMLLFQLCGNWVESNKSISIPLRKFHKDYSFRINRFTEFRRLYIGKAICLNNLREFQKLRKLIHKIKKISTLNPNNKEIDLVIFEDAFFFELESYIGEFRFEKAVEFIKSNMDKIHSLEDKMHSVNIQSKRYRIALSYFGANMPDEALYWLDKILESDKLKFRKDILVSVQLLFLLIHFELKNYQFVKNKLKSVSNYLKKIDRFLIPEKLLINTLYRTDLTSKNHCQLFNTLRMDLEKQFKINNLDSYFFSYFDLVKWISFKYPSDLASE